MQEKNRRNLAKIVIIFFGILIPSFIFFGLFKGPIYAATSDTVNLQGKIVRNDAGYEGLNVTAGNPACVVTGDGNDTCDFRVRYYDASTAGNLLLTEQFSNIEIGQYVGVFNLSLGSDPAPVADVYTSLSSLIQGESDVYVEVSFDPSGLGTYTEVFSRMPLEATAYAVRAKYADNATGATAMSWSGLQDPTADLTLQHSTRKTLFNWATGTGTNDLFSLTSDGSANGTGALMNIQTGTGASLMPLRVRVGSVEGLMVDNQGRVGIGTTTPSTQLHTTGGVRFGGLVADTQTTAVMADVNGNLSTRALGNLAFEDSVAGDNWGTQVVESDSTLIGTGVTGSLLGLNLANANTWTGSQTFSASTYFPGSGIWNSSGNVGIGTLTPQQKLTLSSGSNYATEMASPIGVSTTATTGGTLASGTYYYKVVATDGSGYTVGSSEASCAVDGTTTNACQVSWSSVTGAASYRVYGRVSTQDQYWAATGTSYTDTGTVGTTGSVPTSTTAYVNKVSSSGNSWLLGGNVGIGTTAPSYTLDVSGGTGIVAGFSGRVIGADGVNSNEFVTKSQLDTVGGPVYWQRTSPNISPINANDNVLPNTGGDLGSSGTRWTNVYGTTGNFTNLAATTLTGAITGNSQNITGLNNLTGVTSTFSTSLTTPLIVGNTSLALRPSTDATTGIQLQNAIGANILNVDTTNSRVGIGMMSPEATLDVAKTVAATSDVIGSRVSLTQSASGALTAFGNRIVVTASHTSGSLTGVQANSTQLYFTGSGGTTSYAEGVTSMANVSPGAIVSDLSLMKIFSPTNSGTITNLKGLEISDMNAGYSSNYSIYSEGGTMYHEGNVGIGTPGPLAKLHVKGNQILLKNEVDADVGFAMDSGSTATYRDVISFRDRGTDIFALEKTATNAFQLYDYAGTGASRILVEGGANSGISFRTKGTGDFSFINDITTRVTIKSDGKVGIGTTSPASRFQIGTDTVNQQWSGSTPYVLIQGVDNEVETPAFRVKDENLQTMFDLVTGTGGSVGRAYFGGNVGIGTTSPGELLHLASTGSARIKIEADTDNVTETDIAQLLFSQDGGVVTSRIGTTADNNFEIMHTYGADMILGTSNATRMTIKSGGNVGIGTTSPYSALNVNGNIQVGQGSTRTSYYIGTQDTKSDGYDVSTFGGVGTSGMEIEIVDEDSYGTNSNFPGEQNLHFWTGGRTSAGLIGGRRMTIDYEGNVGIGTTSPTRSLDVVGGIRVSGVGGLIKMVNSNSGKTWEWYTGGSVGDYGLGLYNRTNGRYEMTVSSAGYFSFPQGHGDVAENYKISGTALRGSIVSANTDMEKTLVIANKENTSLIGVISTNPGVVMDVQGGISMGVSTKEVYSNEKAPIALVGLVPVLVTSEEGMIGEGDYIGTSTTSGFGAKMISAGQVVGKTVEALRTTNCQPVSSIDSINWPDEDGTNPSKPCYKLPGGTIVGKVLVAVNVSWYDPKPGELLEKIENIEAQLEVLNSEENLLLGVNSNIEVALNNTYDLGTNENRWKDIYAQGTVRLGSSTDSGGIKYDTETKRLKFTNDGQNWIAVGPPKKSVLLSAQYPGSVVSDSTDVKGTMTTNSTGIDNNFMNYYEWVSSKSDLNTNKIKIRYQIPSDFKQWGDGGITFKYATKSINKEENKLDIYVYDQSSDVPETMSLNNVSSVPEKWESVEVLGLPFNKCTTPGDVCIFVIEMSSSKNYYTRVGDIEVKYERNL